MEGAVWAPEGQTFLQNNKGKDTGPRAGGPWACRGQGERPCGSYCRGRGTLGRSEQRENEAAMGHHRAAYHSEDWRQQGQKPGASWRADSWLACQHHRQWSSRGQPTACLHPALLSPKDISHSGLGPTQGPHFTLAALLKPLSPHSEVLGSGTSTHEFCRDWE